MAGSGVNLRVVQKIMGHARLATVEIYTHATAEERWKKPSGGWASS